jgi:anthranilate phosphoribosyltransferase
MTGEILHMPAHALQNPDSACPEKDRLLKEYQVTTENFSGAVNDLQALRGTSSQEEYERLRRVAEEARLKSEQARLALENHTAAHRC